MTITFKRAVFALVCFCSYKVSLGAVKVVMLILVAEFIVCCVLMLYISVSDAGTFCSLAELNQYYKAEDKVSCTTTQHSVSDEPKPGTTRSKV